MAEITLKGNPIHTCGELPAVGSQAPDFTLTKTDLSDLSLKDLAGKRVILNIFPSVDTSVCALSVKTFNDEVKKLDNAVVVGVSADLPFAHDRFNKEGGIEDLISTSELHDRSFGEAYGVRIVDGPLAGLLSRAVVVIDEHGKVIYTEQVPEIGQEPDYQAALKTLT
ncbi:thiol peroxidase [candidate division KSB3 bacterium]|uniref:Thiol peroxidase n=1 Tax=candidate division KSB3 bacterium TaxID=2044937 RepID=A0A9D5JXD8_9BACT|nr:thiol peroxidase [candidate division KSB3 bacterium]